MKLFFSILLVSIRCFHSKKENGCQFPWINYDKSCYLFIDGSNSGKHDYFSAESTCKNLGATLIPKNLAQNIRQLLLLSTNEGNKPCPFVSFNYSRGRSVEIKENCRDIKFIICQKPGRTNGFSKSLPCPECNLIRKKRSPRIFPRPDYTDERTPHFGSKIVHPWDPPKKLAHQDIYHKIIQNKYYRQLYPTTPTVKAPRYISEKTTPTAPIIQNLLTTSFISVDNSITTMLTDSSVDGPGKEQTSSSTQSSIVHTYRISSSETSTGSCYEGDLRNGKRCYRFSDIEMTWDEANQSCNNGTRNGALLTIDNKEEFNFLGPLVQKHFKDEDKQLWIGISVSRVNVMWLLPSSINRYKNYEPVTKSCGMTIFNKYTMEHDFEFKGYIDCAEKLSFICEYEEMPVTKQHIMIKPTPASGSDCPNGWTWDSEECIKIFDVKVSYGEAEATCKSNGATLLNFNNKKNYRALFYMLFQPFDIFKRLEESTYSIFYWIKNNEKRDIARRTCNAIRLYASPEFFSRQMPKFAPCSSFFSFICGIRNELPKTEPPILQTLSSTPSTTTAQTIEEEPCPETLGIGWIKYMGSCYKFVSFANHKPRTWYEAQMDCSNEGGFLASIHSKQENDWVHAKIEHFQDDFLWIGGKLKKEYFVWEDGSPLDYVNWSEGEPNNLDSEECVVIYTRFSRGKWNDLHCLRDAGYICQKTFPFVTQSSKETVPTNSSTVKTTLSFNHTFSSSSTSHRVSISSTEVVTASNLSAVSMSFPKMTSAKPDVSFSKGIRSSTSSSHIPSTEFISRSTKNFVSTTLKLSTTPSAYTNSLIYTTSSPRTDSLSTTPGKNSLSDYQSQEVIRRCPQEWYKLNLRCVKYFKLSKELTKEEANTECHKHSNGTSLVIIKGKSELEFLQTLITNYMENVWTGLRSKGRGRLIVTAFTFAAWQSLNQIQNSLPNETTSCVALSISDHLDISMTRLKCEAKARSFICERPTQIHEGVKKHVAEQYYTARCKPPYEDFSMYDGSCYKFIENPLNWKQSQLFCQNIGAELATIRNVFEQKFIERQFFNVLVSVKVYKSNPSIWIGLKNTITESKIYHWVSDWPILYTNWKPYDSHGFTYDHEKNCVSVQKKNGYWITERNCEIKQSFLCEATNKTSFLNSQSVISTNCPSGWLDFGNDYCYTVDFSVKRSWPDANHRCMQLGGYLASVHSLEDVKNFKKVIIPLGKPLWIGATRSKENKFVWSDLSNVDFEFWGNEQPYNNVYFTAVKMTIPDGRWVVERSRKENHYICEVRKNAKTKVLLKENIKDKFTSPQRGLSPGGATGIAFIVILIIGIIVGLSYYAYRQKPVKSRPEMGFDSVVYSADTHFDKNSIRTKEESECILDECDLSDNDDKETKLAEIAKRIKV